MKTEQRYDLIAEADWEPCRQDFGPDGGWLSDHLSLCKHGVNGQNHIGAFHYNTPTRCTIELWHYCKDRGYERVD